MHLPGLTIQHHLAEKVNKVRPLALLEKDQNAIEMFSKLGDEKVINDEQCADVENLVCSMYEQNKLSPRCRSSSRNVP